MASDAKDVIQVENELAKQEIPDNNVSAAALPSKKQNKYPLTDGKGFILHGCIIGEVSSGKSTLLNAIFGNFLAQTDIDRTTKTTHRFYESYDENDDKTVLDKIKESNDNEERKMNEENEKFNNMGLPRKFLSKISDKCSSWIQLLNTNGKKAQFNDLETYCIKESALIPRKGAFDNIFSIVDFPGFNDPKLDDKIFETLKQHCKNFDFIFYVVDCQTCLRNKSSKECFAKVMNIIKNELINNHTKLIILFNKYDLVCVREFAKKFVCNQRNEICDTLTNDYNIPRNKFEFFNISANNLLIQRILLNKDINFLSKHPELMDDINVYCGEFLSRKEISRIGNLPLKERLDYINQAMTDSKEIEDTMIVNNDQATEGGNNDTGNNNNENDNQNVTMATTTRTTTQGHFGESRMKSSSSLHNDNVTLDENDENLDGILFFLKYLRNVCVMKEKAQRYLTNLKIDSFDSLVEFFACIFCLTQSKNKTNNYNDINLESIMRSKLVSMMDDIPKYNNGDINLLNKCVLYTLTSLQYCLDSLDDKKFDFSKFVQFLTINQYLTNDLLILLKNKINLNNNKSESYYYQVCQCYVRALVIHFVERNGKQHIFDVNVLIDDIFTYFPNDKQSQLWLLQSLLTSYHGISNNNNNNNSNNWAKAIDLLQYHFDIDDLRKVFPYNEYEMLCCKQIKRNDQTFAKLIEKLKSIIVD